MEEKTVFFKVSSALKNLIGRELITNDYVAVFELVKNSFDAYAKEINVTFDLKENTITIKDDGHGMSPDDIINKWLFIGYSEKKDDDSGHMSGNKGIGRFSCDRLGSSLLLSSTKDGVCSEITINWDEFENNQNDEIQDLNLSLRTSQTNDGSGTFLVISNLRNDWKIETVEKAKLQLEKLVSPNSLDAVSKLFVTVINADGTRGEKQRIENHVFDSLSRKSVFVRTSFENRLIKTELFDSGKRILYNVSRNVSLIKSALMQVFFLDQSAKIVFKNSTSMSVKDYGNVFLYRNKFRVFPYGETNYDLFGLSQRKSQGYNRYLGPREILGWIDLTDKKNCFIEATSRDSGFIMNEYSKELEECYMEYVHRPLEKYVDIINYGNISLDAMINDENFSVILDSIKNSFSFKETIQTSLDEGFFVKTSDEYKINQLKKGSISAKDRKSIVSDIQKKYLNQISEIKKQDRIIKKQKKEQQDLHSEIERKNRLIVDTNPSRQKVLEHDLGIVTKRLEKAIQSLGYFLPTVKDERFKNSLASISICLSRIKGIRNLTLKTNGDINSKEVINFGDFLEEYSKIDDTLGVNVSINQVEKFELEMDKFDLTTIYDNLLSNAIGFDAKNFDIFTYSNRVEFISDSYNGEDVDVSRVFDFGYSTRRKGTGMGMYIVKQVCCENNLIPSFRIIENTNKVCVEIKKDETNN